MSARPSRRVKEELLAHAARQARTTTLSGPLGAVAVYFLMRSSPGRRPEAAWFVVALAVTIVGAFVRLADGRSIRRRPSIYRRPFLANVAVFSASSFVFTPMPASIQAIVQIAVVMMCVLVAVVAAASDIVVSRWVLVAYLAPALIFTPAIRSYPIPLRVLSGVALFLGLLPLTTAIYHPMRRTIELTIANEALVHELRSSNAALSVQVTVDSLTGLANRVGLDQALAEPRQVGLLYVDIDHFKAVNDSLGHAGGDDVLVRLAGALAHAVRPGDVVSRLGGDEFVVLLDGAVASDLPAVAARIRANVNSSLGGEGITVSMGGACGNLTVEPAESVLRRADNGLYAAKRSGRDRVSFAA